MEKYKEGPIFLSTQTREEWEKLDEYTKKLLKSNIEKTAKQLENKIAIEFLACVITDMQKEIEGPKEKIGQK